MILRRFLTAKCHPSYLETFFSCPDISHAFGALNRLIPERVTIRYTSPASRRVSIQWHVPLVIQTSRTSIGWQGCGGLLRMQDERMCLRLKIIYLQRNNRTKIVRLGCRISLGRTAQTWVKLKLSSDEKDKLAHKF